MAIFRPGTSALSCCKMELTISAQSLLDMDIFSKSDPVCVLFVQDFGSDSWHEFGRTECIANNLNPEFAHNFVVDYFFEERQNLLFKLYDIDTNSRNLADHDFLGQIQCSLGEIVSVGRLRKPLEGPMANSGSILVTAEELHTCKQKVTFVFGAKGLDKKGFFTSSNPFLILYKVNEDGSYSLVYRTEVVKNSLNPQWKSFSLSVQTLCGGDFKRSILIKCINWKRNGHEDEIGRVQTNLAALTKENSASTFQLINEEKTAKKFAHKRSGFLVIVKSVLVKVSSFVDFITAGTQMNCTIAIDFTASNGNPLQPGTLHYLNPQNPNAYSLALQAVGEIIQDYDSDKLFPVYGFGARLPPNGMISHNFPINGNESNPCCEGIPSVVEAYHRCLSQIQLYGPTNFAPIINRVAREAANRGDGSEYFILLILTDGVITDMVQTTESIVNASCLPLSIIIVGIGDADFDLMQFVPFREFLGKNKDQPEAPIARLLQARLARSVLEEIPDQFLSYMEMNRIQPGSWHTRGVFGDASRSGTSQASYLEEPPPSYSGLFNS